MDRKQFLNGLLAIALLGLPAAPGYAQTVSTGQESGWALSSRVAIVPQRGVYSIDRPEIVIERVNAAVKIVEQVAITTLDIHLLNKSKVRREAEVLLPVPADATVRGFTFQGSASEPTAKLLPREEAERLYRSIVSRLKDPALLEFVGLNMLKTSVFPLEPGGTQIVRLTYEHILPAEGDRIDYVLPRTEALAYRIPWDISVTISTSEPITTVYSPSHPIEPLVRSLDGSGQHQVSTKVSSAGSYEPGAFRLSYLKGQTSVMAYPDRNGNGGYFLLLSAVPEPPASEDRPVVRREITLVLDRSGSMRGEKLTQAVEAARQIITGLDRGEWFNIIAYNDQIEQLSGEPLEKNAENEERAYRFLDEITARGGTNLHDALAASLQQKPAEGLPLVLFLTDGLPTVGQTSEVAIRALVKDANPHARRVFPFGVGADVNTPLIEAMANDSRGKATFVLPGQDVEASVGKVFRQLDGPVLTEPELVVAGKENRSANRIFDLLPGTLPDLFTGDQLVVLGRYRGDKPMRLILKGQQQGETLRIPIRLDPSTASLRNGFVSRLWASRKVGQLVDAIRRLGAGNTAITDLENVKDPRIKELADEILALTTEFGILTEYTAFLAEEGSVIEEQKQILEKAVTNFRTRALTTRTGVASINQSLNSIAIQGLVCVNGRNGYLGADLQYREVATVQLLNDQTYFRRQGCWMDGRLVANKELQKHDREVRWGTPEFDSLLKQLVATGRQSSLAMPGDVLLRVDGQTVLVHGLQPDAAVEPGTPVIPN